MIRTVVKANKKTLSFRLPDDYIGKELEVIVFSKDEGIQENKTKKNVSFTVLHSDIKNYKFNRDEANER